MNQTMNNFFHVLEGIVKLIYGLENLFTQMNTFDPQKITLNYQLNRYINKFKIKYIYLFYFFYLLSTSVKALFDLLHEQVYSRLAKWVTFLHTAVMATVVMCRVRNPACTATRALGKERYING